ncbi:GNAT family N-acetyltransferase [Pseudoneobacillus sp. C159]
MEIRKASGDDWNELWELLYLMGKTDNEDNVKLRFLNMFDDKQHFIPVAVLDGKLVGYGWVQDYGFHLRSGKKISRMNDLFVHPEHRRSGVATALFLAIKEWAKANRTNWLQWNSSPSAVGFYQCLDLSPLVEEDNYPFFEVEF